MFAEIGWGVDGYGNRHYCCNHCGMQVETPLLDFFKDHHNCDDMPKDFYRGKKVVCEGGKLHIISLMSKNHE